MAGERTLKVTIVGDADRLSNTFKGLGQDLGGFGSQLDSLKAKFPQLAGPIDGVTTKLEGLGAGKLAAIGGVTALGAVAVVAGKQLFGLGNDFDAAYDKIQIATGKTGKDLEALKASFRSVAGEVPSSFGQVSDAIAGLSAQTSVTGGDLESLALQVLNLSRLTGTDLTGNVQLVAKVMQDWKLPADAVGSTLDALFVSSQQTGVSFSDLSSRLDQFGPTLRGLGLDVLESTNLLASMSQQGVDVDKVMVGLTRAVTTSGLSLEELTRRVSAGTTEADRMEIAVDLLGKKVGLEFIDALKSGKINLESLSGTLGDTRGAINKTADDTDDGAEKMSKAWNRTKLALEPLANAVFDLSAKLMDKLASAIDWVNTNFETLKRVGLAIVTGGLTEVDNLAGLAGQALSRLGDLAGTIIEPFRTAFGAVLAAVGPVIDALAKVIGLLGSINSGPAVPDPIAARLGANGLGAAAAAAGGSAQVPTVKPLPTDPAALRGLGFEAPVPVSRRTAAYGAFVPARAGGWDFTVGEGGQDEVIAPVPMLRRVVREETGRGGGIVVNVYGSVIRERDLVLSIRDGLLDLQRQGVSLGFN